MKNTERKLYIDGLKGGSCLLIMLGHFTGIYKYAEDATRLQCGITDVLTTSLLRVFTVESFWLYLFFVVSGFLLAYTSVNSLLDIIKKTILRFLRLAIPILGAAIIIYLIQILFGFYNMDLQQYITNPWLASFYSNGLSLYDVIMSPFMVLIKGINTINSPYWVLRDMFISSILIYIILYVNNKLKTKIRFIGELTSILLLVGTLVLHRPIIFACVLGMAVNREMQWIEKIYKKCWPLLFISLLLPIAGLVAEN